MLWDHERYREYRMTHQYDISTKGFAIAISICPDITIGQLQTLWDESVKETLDHFGKSYIVDCGIQGTGYQMYLFEKKVSDYKNNIMVFDTDITKHNPEAICEYIEGNYNGYDRCQLCGCEFTAKHSNFCPGCGVKFVGHRRY